jgi:hypothetical protein
MDFVNHADRIEQIGFAGAGSGAAHINAGHRALGAENHGTAGSGFEIAPVPNL